MRWLHRSLIRLLIHPPQAFSIFQASALIDG
jgi:hypothetical protein